MIFYVITQNCVESKQIRISMQLYPPLNPLPRGDFSIPLLGGVRGIRVKLSDWGGWHGQTLFVRAFLATHNGTKSTGNVADHCPPLAGGRGVEKEHENNAGKTKSR